MSDQTRQTIAIVLICYNQQDFIVEALDGIRNQTREPEEVIIADDGSTDNTHRMIQEYVRRHNLEKKWLLLLSQKNRGINKNIQAGLDHATADIIILMAGDDISLENRCSVTEELFRLHPLRLMISTSGYVINKTGEIIREVAYPDSVFDDIEEAIRHGNPRIMPVGHAMRREIFSRFGNLPTDVPNEDDQTTFRGLISGGIARSSIKTFKYRIHDQSASAWLHKRQSGDAYFERFKVDMSVRARHMRYWHNALEKTQFSNKEKLLGMADLKARFYVDLGSIDSTPLRFRLRYLSVYRNVLTMKDSVYCIFGASGVRSWQRLRRLLGRA